MEGNLLPERDHEVVRPQEPLLEQLQWWEQGGCPLAHLGARQRDRQTDTETETETETDSDRQRDRQTEGQDRTGQDRQTDRQDRPQWYVGEMLGEPDYISLVYGGIPEAPRTIAGAAPVVGARGLPPYSSWGRDGRSAKYVKKKGSE